MSWLRRLVQRSEQAPTLRVAIAPPQRAVVDPADPELAGRAEERGQADVLPRGPSEGDASSAASRARRAPAAQRIEPTRAVASAAEVRAGRGVGAVSADMQRGALEASSELQPQVSARPASEAHAPQATRADAGVSAAQRSAQSHASDRMSQPASEVMPQRAHAPDPHAPQRTDAASSVPSFEPPARHSDASMLPAPSAEAGQRDANALEARPHLPAQALLPQAAARPMPAPESAPQLSIGRLVIEVGAPAVKLVAPPAKKPRRSVSSAAAPATRSAASSRRFGLGVS